MKELEAALAAKGTHPNAIQRQVKELRESRSRELLNARGEWAREILMGHSTWNDKAATTNADDVPGVAPSVGTDEPVTPQVAAKEAQSPLTEYRYNGVWDDPILEASGQEVIVAISAEKAVEKYLKLHPGNDAVATLIDDTPTHVTAEAGSPALYVALKDIPKPYAVPQGGEWVITKSFQPPSEDSIELDLEYKTLNFRGVSVKPVKVDSMVAVTADNNQVKFLLGAFQSIGKTPKDAALFAEEVLDTLLAEGARRPNRTENILDLYRGELLLVNRVVSVLSKGGILEKTFMEACTAQDSQLADYDPFEDN